MNDLRPIRQVPDLDLPPLTNDEAIEKAKNAYFSARELVIERIACNSLFSLMFRDKRMVSYRRLQGMRYEARMDLDRAQKVLAGIEQAIEAIERTVANTTG